MVPATYCQWPEFQTRLQELTTEKNQYYHDLVSILSRDATTEELDAFDRTWDAYKAAHQQRVLEAHQQFHVPVLQSWRKSLDQTGNAVFHQERMLHEGQQKEATLLQDPKTKRITLIFKETYAFPRHLTLENIQSHLSSMGVSVETWEAVSLELSAAPWKAPTTIEAKGWVGIP